MQTALAAFSQDLRCGTVPTKKDIAFLRSIDQALPKKNSRMAEVVPVELAVTAHIIRNSTGQGGLSEEQILSAFDGVNSFYANAGMSFFILTFNYIDDDQFFDFETSDEAKLTSVNNLPNTINIYFANTVGNGDGAFYCGYAYFPGGGTETILMDNSCTLNGSTLPHEIGHFFSLYHTHGKSNTGTTDELVDGSNCEEAGDNVCDTAADPNLRGKVQNSTCSYTGTNVDANGELFVPNPRNIMSYSTKNCRDEFSLGQFGRIRNGYEQGRPNLSKNKYLIDYKAIVSTICIGSEVPFVNRTVGAEAFLWTFEGGTPKTSTNANPIVSYSAAGSFSVSLKITTIEGNEVIKEITDYITVIEPPVINELPKSGSFEEDEVVERILNDDDFTFQKNINAASEGNISISIDNFNFDRQGSRDYLILGTTSSEISEFLELSFDYAYAPYNENIFDRLSVAFKHPCSSNWKVIWAKEGADLATAPATTGLFVPANSSDWSTVALDLSLPKNFGEVEIALINTNGWGNVLYIDNYILKGKEVFSIDPSFILAASCPDSDDGAIEINVQGEGTFEYSLDNDTYKINNTFQDLRAGEYTVYVRDQSGFVRSQNEQVTYLNEYPDSPLISLRDEGSLQVTSSTPESIQWYFNGEMLEGEVTDRLHFDQFGEYTVEVSNGNCSVISEPFIVLFSEQVLENVTIYPNPFADHIKLDLPIALEKEVVAISLTDLSGREVNRWDMVDVLSTDNLNAGFYLLMIHSRTESISIPVLKE